jgi:hypothetical protein
MKIKIEMEIEHCYQCPYADYVSEMGYNGTECKLLGAYSTIPQTGIKKNCPFLQKPLDKSLKV